MINFIDQHTPTPPAFGETGSLIEGINGIMNLKKTTFFLELVSFLADTM
jgi:hypothetical protein